MPAPRNTHLAVMDALRRDIANGRFERCTADQIARTHSVARSTALRAVHLLQAEGLVDIIQGDGIHPAGMVNRTPLIDRLTDLLRTPTASVGDPFPTELELCAKLSVSRSTLRIALSIMEARGLVGRRGGRGRIVLALPPDKEDA